jgi:hypothetical protein
MIINNKKITKIIGPVNIHILQPINNDFPVIILFSDLHYFPNEKQDIELKKNEYKLYGDDFLSLLNDSKYKIDIFLEHGYSINLNEWKNINHKPDEKEYLLD